MRIIPSNISDNISPIFGKKNSVPRWFYTSIGIDGCVICIHPQTERTSVPIRTVAFTARKGLCCDDTISSWNKRRYSFRGKFPYLSCIPSKTSSHSHCTSDGRGYIESKEIGSTRCTENSTSIRKITSTSIFITNRRKRPYRWNSNTSPWTIERNSCHGREYW